MSNDQDIGSGIFTDPEETEGTLHCSPGGASAPDPEEVGPIFGRAAAGEMPEDSFAAPPASPSAPVCGQQRGGQKGSKTLRAVLITLGALVVIAVVLLLTLGPKFALPEISVDFDAQLPFSDSEKEPSRPYDSVDDFFHAYYSDEISGVADMPTAEARSDLKLELTEAPAAELTLPEIYEKCARSVVGVTAGKNGLDRSWGTGILFSEDGYIVTNEHIIDGQSTARVVLWDDSEYEAELIGYDANCDLAVLKIDKTGLTPAEFGDSSALRVGESVVAIGNPLGEDFRGTMTDGIISAIDRNVEYNGRTMTLLQTNAAINEGNSGGPLINRFGQVIGITNMKMTSYYSSIEGIGFAIPSRVIQSMVTELIDKGYVSGRPAIGITIGQMPEGVAEEYDIPEGLYIMSVEKNSDAYGKGIQAGDILLAVNGQPVKTSEEVNAIKNELAVGDRLTLTIFREGETFDVEIVLFESGEVFRR